MCLSNVTVTEDQPSTLIVDGWKVFAGTDRLPEFDSRHGAVKLDQWLQASGPELKASDGKSYKAGFHVYREERTRPRRRRVYVRAVTCLGYQDMDETMIAQEMYVPSDPNAWPPLDTAPAKQAAPAKRLRDRLHKGGRP